MSGSFNKTLVSLNEESDMLCNGYRIESNISRQNKLENVFLTGGNGGEKKHVYWKKNGPVWDFSKSLSTVVSKHCSFSKGNYMEQASNVEAAYEIQHF